MSQPKEAGDVKLQKYGECRGVENMGMGRGKRKGEGGETSSGSSKKAGAACTSAVVPASQSLAFANHMREDLVPAASFLFL